MEIWKYIVGGLLVLICLVIVVIDIMLLKFSSRLTRYEECEIESEEIDDELGDN